MERTLAPVSADHTHFVWAYADNGDTIGSSHSFLLAASFARDTARAERENPQAPTRGICVWAFPGPVPATIFDAERAVLPRPCAAFPAPPARLFGSADTTLFAWADSSGWRGGAPEIGRAFEMASVLRRVVGGRVAMWALPDEELVGVLGARQGDEPPGMPALTGPLRALIG